MININSWRFVWNNVNRILRDDPSKSGMHNREGLSLRMMWACLKDWKLWPLYILGLTFLSELRRSSCAFMQLTIAPVLVPITPPQNYLPLSLRELGFDTTQSNLLSIPSTALGIINLFIFCYLSELIDSRTVAMLTMQIWTLPLLIALYTFGLHTSSWVSFAVVSLILAYPFVQPVQVAWASTNSASVQLRTVSASLYNMFAQAGGIVAVSPSPLGLQVI